jgi:Gas vesicle synthesis protein GvpL/GvpF
MKLYAYCLTQGIDSITEAVRGVSETPVRLLKIEEVAVLVSDLEIDSVPVTRENVLAHAAVVRSVLDRTTPLPFRFGTLVTEAQLRSYVSTRKPAIEAKLAHVRDCVEMSVKIIWQAASTEHNEAIASAEGSGTSFLKEKRRELLGDEHRSKEVKEISEWLHQTVSGLTRDEQTTVKTADKVMLAASHLVERAKLKQYQAKVTEARGKRPNLHFLLSGPWPPYSFVNIELEFKTQFGVS